MALNCAAFAFRIIRLGDVALPIIFRPNVGFISALNAIHVLDVINALFVISVLDVILFNVAIFSIFIVLAFLASFRILRS